MYDITPDTWGWTAISWNIGNGCVGQWFRTLDEAYNFAKDNERRRVNVNLQTKKIEFIRRQYKDRMNRS